MTIQTIERNNLPIAVIEAEPGEFVLTDVQTALDLMASVRYGTEIDRMILPKSAVCEDFFILSTGLAGEVLQKFINYGMKLAIYGDYSRYTSKPLRDFIYESNNGKDIFFAPDLGDAAERLSRAR